MSLALGTLLVTFTYVATTFAKQSVVQCRHPASSLCLRGESSTWNNVQPESNASRRTEYSAAPTARYIYNAMST